MTITKEIFPHPLSVHSYLLRIRGSVGMYMESGLLDLLNIAPLNEDTYKPADLYYDDTLSAYWQTDEALMGEIKVSSSTVTYDPPRDEGPSETSVGCDPDDLINTITMRDDIFTGDTQLASSASAVFCPEVSDMLIRKRTQRFFPSSAFNAKMRLWIQSIYGSKRTDYKMDPDFGFIGGLQLGSYAFDPYFGTTGLILYTGSDYQYYLIELSSSNVRINRLELSKQGEKLRDWLVDNPQSATETRRYEGYLLSTATFGDWSGGMGDVSDAYAKGDPFAYSWKANWDGTQAQIVTHRLKSGSDRVWQFTHFGLDISLDDPDDWAEASSWTFSLSEIEATQEATLRINEDLVWFPDYANGGMELFVTQPDGASDPTHVESDVPIYIVYDYDTDDFDVVRFKRENKGSGVGSLGGNLTNSSQRAGPGCADSDCDFYSETNDDVLEVGFYIDGDDDFTGVGKEAFADELVGNEASVGDVVGSALAGSQNSVINQLNECGFGLSAPDFDDWSSFWNSAFAAEFTPDSMDITHESMVIMPYFDCDSIYLGRWSEFSYDGVKGGFTSSGARVVGSYTIRDGETVLFEQVRGEVLYGSALGTGRHTILAVANDEGKWNTYDLGSGDGDDVKIQLFSNGEWTEVHEQQRVSDSDLASKMHVPACVSASLGWSEGNNWESEDYKDGGFGNHWDPVIFPTLIKPSAVIVRQNLTGNFRATKNPAFSTWVDEGEYDYDTYSDDISFVGHD